MPAGKITARVSGVQPVPHEDSHALATETQLVAATARLATVGLLGQLPVPRGKDFWAACLIQASELSAQAHATGAPLSPLDCARLAARRQLKVWLSHHPKQAAFHRRFKTSRWMYAKDGNL